MAGKLYKVAIITTILCLFIFVNFTFYFGDDIFTKHIVSKICTTIQLGGGVIISLGYIFQIIRIINRKSVNDISQWQLVMVLLACFCFQGYAVYNIANVWAFFITNSLCCVLAIIEMSLYIVYKDYDFKRVEMMKRIRV